MVKTSQSTTWAKTRFRYHELADDWHLAECGDAVIPGVILGVTASRGKIIHCETHGWQAVARKLRTFEVVNMTLGRPLNYREPLPDEPLF